MQDSLSWAYRAKSFSGNGLAAQNRTRSLDPLRLAMRVSQSVRLR